MVMHIVMFQFQKGTSETIKEEIKQQIEELADLVPGLLNIKVGHNFAQEDRAMDMVLISHFESKEDLDFYATHPEHLKVVEYIKTVAEYSKVVDFEA